MMRKKMLGLDFFPEQDRLGLLEQIEELCLGEVMKGGRREGEGEDYSREGVANQELGQEELEKEQAEGVLQGEERKVMVVMRKEALRVRVQANLPPQVVGWVRVRELPQVRAQANLPPQVVGWGRAQELNQVRVRARVLELLQARGAGAEAGKDAFASTLGAKGDRVTLNFGVPPGLIGSPSLGVSFRVGLGGWSDIGQ